MMKWSRCSLPSQSWASTTRSSWLPWRNTCLVRFALLRLDAAIILLHCPVFFCHCASAARWLFLSVHCDAVAGVSQGGWRSVIRTSSAQSWSTACRRGAAPSPSSRPWRRTLCGGGRSTPPCRLPGRSSRWGDSTTCHR